MGNTDIGLQLLTSDLALFLKIRATFATFHSLGKMPLSIELLNMLVGEGPTISPDSFNSLQGILSNPVAFLSFMSLNNLQTVITLRAFKRKHFISGLRIGVRFNICGGYFTC